MAPIPWTTEQHSKIQKFLCELRYRLKSTLKNPNFESMDGLGKVRSCFPLAKWNFEHIMNSVHTAKLERPLIKISIKR